MGARAHREDIRGHHGRGTFIHFACCRVTLTNKDNQTAIAILTDLGAIYFLYAGMSQPSTPVAIAVLDAIALVMCAVGIPSVMGSEFKTQYDTAVWALAVVIMYVRVFFFILTLATPIVGMSSQGH